MKRRMRPSVICIGGICALMLVAAPGAARSEGLFDFLFGSDPEPRMSPAPAPRGGWQRRPVGAREDANALRRRLLNRGERGEARGGEMSGGSFCVRACDGYFFPLIKSSRASSQQSCEFLCPSAQVELYRGASIEQARNAKGEHYAALPTAFRFRDKATDKCSCNDPTAARSVYADMANNDPTLRSGDVVIEDSGPFVYNGSTLVTLGRASFVPSHIRDRLRAMLHRDLRSGASAAAEPAAASSSPPNPAAEAPAEAHGSIEFGEAKHPGAAPRIR